MSRWWGSLAGDVRCGHHTADGRLKLSVGYLEAQLAGQTPDHDGGLRAKFLEIDPHGRNAGQREVAGGDQVSRRLSPLLFVGPPTESIQRSHDVGCGSVYHNRHQWTPGRPDVVHRNAKSGVLHTGPTFRNAGGIAMIDGPISKFHSQGMSIH